ncbi:MAG: hypothetical protein LKF30_09760 [Sphingobium sp.]|jgi:hypothetical protein|nr:hypothetical protein [Sphingobium sp.]MCI1271779.1 hypothetical protein [Sphingobium sp.]MCI1755075.1 hypothetical protein [Sphingobium sp.]MCI2053718.1 hypothetical protein [Sphingobium sp.]
MTRFARVCAALAPLLLLSGCLLSPGKFTSSLDIRKDGAFTFVYVGEVVVSEQDEAITPDAAGANGEDKPGATASPAKKQEAAMTKAREIAEALAKEKGFRSVKVIGDHKLSVDYRISGRLDHSFLFPFNIDAKAIIPFLAVEVRADGKVRMQAPAFGNAGDASPMGDMGGMGGGDKAAKERNGTFTLTTDAEIVSQNEESGATDTPRGKQVVWKITPQTRAVPMAVLKLAP